MKKIILVLAMVAMIFLFCGVGSASYSLFGNQTLIDLTFTFDYAQIAMPDGSVIQGKVNRWCDYENSDCIQIEIGGVTYLTHYENVVMYTR
jgi:hypothetical protein